MTPWWRRAVVYQVYVRSFADADGDGIGDLEGLRRRLDHIASLGVDAIWLCPISPSPQRDHGYDVADYCDVDPVYGDLTSFDRLVSDAHGLDLRLLMDMVPNHCSDEHPWFRAALARPPGSDERARFWFRDGRAGSEEGRTDGELTLGRTDGELTLGPPNNWPAVFGGSVWTPVGGDDPQWYLGTFTPYQPDFDHRHPAVEAMFADALRFWLDRGVDGFRVDAVWPVGKHPDLPDCPPLAPGEFNPSTRFRPEGHEVWRRGGGVVDDHAGAHPGRDRDARRRGLHATAAGPAGRLHPARTSSTSASPSTSCCRRGTPLDAPGDQRGVRARRTEGAWPTFVLNNHDCQRIVTRLGHDGVTAPEAWTGNNLRHPTRRSTSPSGRVRARAAAGLLLAMPGAVYLYQGEELGLPEVLDLPDDVPPGSRVRPNRRRAARPRRVPRPAAVDGRAIGAHGFSLTGEATAPWLPQPDEWGATPSTSRRPTATRCWSCTGGCSPPPGAPRRATTPSSSTTPTTSSCCARGPVLVVCNAGRRAGRRRRRPPGCRPVLDDRRRPTVGGDRIARAWRHHGLVRTDRPGGRRTRTRRR